MWRPGKAAQNPIQPLVLEPSACKSPYALTHALARASEYPDNRRHITARRRATTIAKYGQEKEE